MSYKSERLKKILKAKGYTKIKIWWEPIGPALEMCGNSGGWICKTEQSGYWPLGYNFEDALKEAKESHHFEHGLIVDGR